MSARQAGPYDNIARRWLALMERRQEHLLELSDTGRWRRYFSQVEFEREMRRAALLRDRWARLAAPQAGENEARDLAEELAEDLPEYSGEHLAQHWAEVEDEAAA